MVGDSADFLTRLRAVLPTRWFSDASPVLNGVLAGLADTWQRIYYLYNYALMQTRVATASDFWLDRISTDFFGPRLPRRSGEADAAFRIRILRELRRERGTRMALCSALTDLTGRAPGIFEPARPGDTGGYSIGGVGYCVGGGYGSLQMPYQCFVTAYRPSASGIAYAAGYNIATGGYGAGAVQYASLTMLTGQVTDADIMAVVAGVLPVATTAWVRISS